jgi:hypothetical protein
VKYTNEIIAGCTAGLLLTAVLSWRQWQQQEQAFIESTRLEVHSLSRLAQSQLRAGGAIALPHRTDPWGSPYNTAAAAVCSPGPDKSPNTKDDICAP